MGRKAEAASPGFANGVRPALIRLEDVGPGGLYQDMESLDKLKVLADYLHQEGIPFHVALIPRFIVPQRGYDVSITDDTPYARSFVDTIKYMQDRGGIIGMHGYTHQSGYTASGAGFEFYDATKNPGVPDSYDYARSRIDRATDLLEKAGITPGFWETPHYTASVQQYPAFQEQTGLLYENLYRGELANRHIVYDQAGVWSRGFVTVPTPLGYIGGDVTADKMLKYLDRVKDTQLASFFYHPFREFSYIKKTKNEKGEDSYVYDPGSPLHLLVKGFRDRGYTFVSAYSLVGFVPAQRLAGLAFSEGDRMVAGRFGGGDRQMVLVWNRSQNEWRLYGYTAQSHSPRRVKAFANLGVAIRGWVTDDSAVPLAADFNGDKRDDLAAFCPGSGSFYIALSSGERLVPTGEEVSTGSESRLMAPMTGDFNGDGLADLAVNDRENYRVGVAYSTGKGFRQFDWQDIDLIRPEGQDLVSGDFNGDSRSDIAVLDGVTGEWRVLITGPDGEFNVSGEPWLVSWAPLEDSKPFSADVDGDGLGDLVIYNRNGHWQVVGSNGSTFIRRGDFGPWGAGEKAVPLVADLNGDGGADLIIVDGSIEKGYSLDTAISAAGAR